MFLLKTSLLFLITAFFELLGCYLPLLVVKQHKSLWLLPASLSLAIFAYLLTLHPTASGRTYAAYGCVYIFAAMLWLNWVDKIPLSKYDLAGIMLALLGMIVIVSQPK